MLSFQPLVSRGYCQKNCFVKRSVSEVAHGCGMWHCSFAQGIDIIHLPKQQLMTESDLCGLSGRRVRSFLGLAKRRIPFPVQSAANMRCIDY